MFTLKPLSKDAIPSALAKAERYRLLNEPGEAESICLDVLQIEPDNQEALVSLLLAITDQFQEELSEGVRRAREVLPRLTDEYRRAYYSGIICERRAKAQLHRGALGSAEVAADWFAEAMTWYERAEKMRPPDDDEALRFALNTLVKDDNRRLTLGEFRGRHRCSYFATVGGDERAIARATLAAATIVHIPGAPHFVREAKRAIPRAAYRRVPSAIGRPSAISIRPTRVVEHPTECLEIHGQPEEGQLMTSRPVARGFVVRRA